MKKILLIIAVLMLFQALNADKYAGEIFRMGAGVKNYAQGNLGLTDETGNALSYWNSALLTEAENNRFEFMHAEEYSGLLKYDTFSAIWGNQEKFSLLITRIGIDDIPLTKFDESTQRPYKYKSVNNSDIVIYFGIARKFGKIVLGFTPKFAYRNLAEHSGYGFGADISTYHDFSEKLRIAAKVRDFFTTQIFWENETHETVNPGFDLECRYKFIFPILKQQAKIYLSSEIYTEDRDYASTFSLNIFSLDPHLGFELPLSRRINFLMGYNVQNLTFGLIFDYRNWQVNYGFENNAELDNSHRISIGYTL
ncbi:MAG: hypothetical protein K8S23_15390 [Candidatus Cloacimonetes bacterium]|nr:hypothetical protein [Candidatus Cloacimonadota bacterium]